MSAPTSKIDYKSTLNLPQTAFPMKADLANKELLILKRWQDDGLYAKIQQKNAGRKKFLLHDGPPYANGDIHFGHILNKVLKDIIIRYKNMAGWSSPFRPGWDCHGLPIEHEVDKELGARKKGLSKIEIRKACRAYAERWIQIQRQEFQRLGVLGEWERPYLTMNYDYEASIAREFARFVRAGQIYRKKKPVLWCPNCQTALAEAEVEYEEIEAPSIYVRFPLEQDCGEVLPKLKGQRCSVVIWTTTPWTLPANLAVALHPSHDYVAFPFQDECLIVAKNLYQAFCGLLGIEPPQPIERFAARSLEGRTCRHPFLTRSPPLVLSDHVTVDTGTGAVHIAPGHGEEDYEVGLRYGLATLTPVDAEGRFTDEVGVSDWRGLKVLESEGPILETLRCGGGLLHSGKLRHSYPHCWRCKNPVISRATEQWFLSLKIGDLREKTLDAIRRVNWIPAWGRDRIFGMVQNRPDWCLSRQRSWGVPIPALKCSGCSGTTLDPEVAERVAEVYSKEGADAWFTRPLSDLVPPTVKCPTCKGTDWAREEDILDVWFDSGVSFAAVVEKDFGLPADLYLEGSDQHRGWFQSSLITSMGTRAQAPYQTVVTHGFVVDGQGKKYSKSARNYIPPEKVLKENGAEILRLWVAAEDYRNDMRVSDEIFKRLIDAYRKIRNTCRFLLGNLHDYMPDAPDAGGTLLEIDQWALHNVQKLVLRLQKAYEDLDLHIIFHELNRYCTVDLSAFYLDILKDRLYTFAAKDPRRRGAQRVLFETVGTLARLMAPILSFTAEEIWDQIPGTTGKSSSVHLEEFPQAHTEWIDEGIAARWTRFREVRDDVLKALEKARQADQIGNSLEARVVLFGDSDIESLLKSLKDLPSLFLVSQVEWAEEPPQGAYQSEQSPKFMIRVSRAEGTKCERCWRWLPSVGQSTQHPGLCERCVEVVG